MSLAVIQWTPWVPVINQALEQSGAASEVNENNVALGQMQSALDIAKSTSESWSEVWKTAVSPSGELWAALVSFGLLLAGLSLLYVAVASGKEIIEKQSWSELVNLFVFPIIILVMLGGNGKVLAGTVQAIHTIGTSEVRRVLEMQLASTVSGTTMLDSVAQVGSNNAGKAAIEQEYRACVGKTGEDWQQCWSEATGRTTAIVTSAERQSGGQLPELRAYAKSLADAATADAQESEASKNNDVKFGALGDIAMNLALSLIQAILLAVQWAFVNVVEAALLLTAMFAPIAMGLSMLPIGGRPIIAWLTGFMSLFGLQLGYNILVGISATVILKAGAVTSSDMGFLFFIALFAPILASVIATGGGVALYQGISSGAKTIISFSTDALGATNRAVVKATEQAKSGGSASGTTL